MSYLVSTPDGVQLTIRVTPRSSRNRVDGPIGDALKIRLNAPPVEGKANEALLEFLAERLDLPRRAIALLAGTQGRLKRVLVRGVTAEQVAARLGA